MARCYPIRQTNPSYKGFTSLRRDTLAGLPEATLAGPRTQNTARIIFRERGNRLSPTSKANA